MHFLLHKGTLACSLPEHIEGFHRPLKGCFVEARCSSQDKKTSVSDDYVCDYESQHYEVISIQSAMKTHNCFCKHESFFPFQIHISGLVYVYWDDLNSTKISAVNYNVNCGSQRLNTD